MPLNKETPNTRVDKRWIGKSGKNWDGFKNDYTEDCEVSDKSDKMFKAT